MSSADSTHDCGATVGTLAAALTSYTVCFDSAVWSCKDRKFDARVAAISAAAFLAVNAVQSRLHKDFVATAHLVTGLLPSILYLDRELRACSARGEKLKDAATRYAQSARMLPIIALPLAIYFIASHQGLHDSICSTLHKLEYTKSKTSGLGVDLNAVRARARDAIHAAETSLRNATAQVADNSAAYSYDLSL